MSRTARCLAMLVLFAAGIAPVSAAQAQWSSAGARRPPPLYPYELQPGQSYAVEVAPGTYVIHHPAGQRTYRNVHRRAKHVARHHQAVPKPKIKPKRTHADRALIEELRLRAATRDAKKAAKKAPKSTGRKPDQIINTRKVVRDKPLVIETRRIVNDPPKIIERRHYVDDMQPRHTGSIARKPADNEDPRVIHADAEITILGPDRMSIRLVRKGGGRLDANARARKVK